MAELVTGLGEPVKDLIEDLNHKRGQDSGTGVRPSVYKGSVKG